MFLDKKTVSNTGVALYLAILIGTILIAAGLGVSTIFYRELRISKLQAPSIIAFYASDAGLECAHYWDLNKDVFDPLGPPPATVRCQGADRTVTHSISADTNGPYDNYTFQFQLTAQAKNACADVRVKKQTVIVSGVPVDCTRIDSFGRDAACGISATVERGFVSIDPEWCPVLF